MPDTKDPPPQTRPNLLLDALPEAERKALLKGGKRKHYEAGAEVLSMGTKGDTALLIETGRVRIKVTSPEGKQTVLSNLGPGEIVGELAVIDGGVRSADAIAATDVTGTQIGRAALMKLLKTQPAAALGLIEALCLRIRQTNDALAAQTMASGSARLARVLDRMFQNWSSSKSGKPRLGATISQSELGDMAGLTRESTNRILRNMQTDGIIEREGGELVLIAPQALQDMAYGER